MPTGTETSSGNDIKNPLKGRTEYGWHFEQNVYSEDSLVRTLKSSEGSGNKPKVILNELNYIGAIDSIERWNKEDSSNLSRNFSEGQRVYGIDGIAKTLNSPGGGMGAKTGLYLVGNVNPSGKGMNGEVYDARGLCPTLTINKGEGQKIVIPVLTPDRIEKRQNGRRFKEHNDPMFTLNCQDRHSVLLIKEATNRGFAEAGIGDSVNFSVPTSSPRRGRVGKQVANTLDTQCNQGVVIHNTVCEAVGSRQGSSSEFKRSVSSVYQASGKIRRLTPVECERLQGFPDGHTAGQSDSQRYKQLGNAVTVNVIRAIARHFEE